MFVLPYSPRWLAKQGREEEAKATLIRLHGAHNARHEVVEAEFAEMLTQIEWGEWGVSPQSRFHLPLCPSQCVTAIARNRASQRDETMPSTLHAWGSDLSPVNTR
jgi:hypothetical protein